MSNSIKTRLNAMPGSKGSHELKVLFDLVLADLTALRATVAAAVVDVAAIRTRSLTGTLTPATLVIGTASKLVPKASKPFTALAGGTLVFKAADTAMSALVGTIAQSKFGLWAFYIDSAGTITTSTKTADADTAAAAFALMPAVPASKAQIGFIIVTNSGEAFDGGTDDLDKASTTVIYCDTVGHQTVPVALTGAAPSALTLLT